MVFSLMESNENAIFIHILINLIKMIVRHNKITKPVAIKELVVIRLYINTDYFNLLFILVN